MPKIKTRILIAGSTSLLNGREETHWIHAISGSLKEMGFLVDTLMLPVSPDPLLLQEQMMALRLLDTENSCDLLLTVGYPAFVLKHPRKRVLLFSLASNLHEWFDSAYGILATPQYLSIRNAIYTAEKRCLMEAERIFCASKTLADQIQDEYKLDAKPFILNDKNLNEFSKTELSENDVWVVCETTLEPCDRVDLLLDAVAASNKNWKLNIFIPTLPDVYYSALIQRIERLGIKERVVITNGAVSALVLKRTTTFISLRYKTVRVPEGVVRAINANVPVITLTDCGALLEVVKNNINGLTLAPQARDIAQILDHVNFDINLLKQLSRDSQQIANMIVDTDVLVQDLVR